MKRRIPVVLAITWAVGSWTSSLGVAAESESPSAAADRRILVVRHEVPPPTLEIWRSLSEMRIPLPGFRADLTQPSLPASPASLPHDPLRPNVRKAAEHIVTRLAFDGLLATLEAAIDILGVAEFGAGEPADLELLRRIGLPVDLLPYFAAPGAHDGQAYSVVREVLRRKISRQPRERIRADLDLIPFQFRKSHPGFRATADSGGNAIGLFRFQFTRGDYWRGRGDGSALDIARQIVAAAPDAEYIASVEDRFVDPLLGFARQWNLSRPRQLTIITEPLPVSQWAQDNGKAGVISSPGVGDAATSTRLTLATLAPRYACRGEEGTLFVPGETFLLGGLAAAGHTVVQSPLLFQGGNVLIAEYPANGERTLLLGEAEVHRNVALGLTRDQVIEAFRIEFDAQRVEVLPAASYHIDYEVSVRAGPDRLIAFVNDARAAMIIVLRLGAKALNRAGLLDSTRLDEALRSLESASLAEFLRIVGPVVDGCAVAAGNYPESLTQHFSTGLSDSGVGNFQRFLLALDLATVGSAGRAAPSDPAMAEYLSTFIRRDADRADIKSRLESLGFMVVPIPSLAEEDLSLNYLNGIHTKDMYLMPAAGGFYVELDAASTRAFSDALGPDVRIVPITCGESQRRLGAVRCAVAAYQGTEPVTVRPGG